jgi:hypothetical protein
MFIGVIYEVSAHKTAANLSILTPHPPNIHEEKLYGR